MHCIIGLHCGLLYTCCIIFDFKLVYAILQILVKYRQEKSGWAVDKPSSPFSFKDKQIKGLLKDDCGNGWHAVINVTKVVSSLAQIVTQEYIWICFHAMCYFSFDNDTLQVQPDDLKYDDRGITSPKLLKKAVNRRNYPPSITCLVTYREELRRTGKPVWVILELLGAETELTFACKAYENLNGAGNGE